jgi:hypothetical protein
VIQNLESREEARILVRDDSQIEFLSCSYDSQLDKDGLRLRVRRLSDFFEDLELYTDIANANVGSRFEFEDDRFEEERRETSPMPPAPSGDWISYGPSLVSAVRAIRARHYIPRQCLGESRRFWVCCRRLKS